MCGNRYPGGKYGFYMSDKQETQELLPACKGNDIMGKKIEVEKENWREIPDTIEDNPIFWINLTIDLCRRRIRIKKG